MTSTKNLPTLGWHNVFLQASDFGGIGAEKFVT
jgi:hypothetical protein